MGMGRGGAGPGKRLGGGKKGLRNDSTNIYGAPAECPVPSLACCLFSKPGVGWSVILVPGPTLPGLSEPSHLLAKKEEGGGGGSGKAIWESAANKTDKSLCPHGADIIVRRDTRSASEIRSVRR